MKKTVAILASAALLTACSISPRAYYNRGDPENLLDVSTEVVHLSLSSHESIRQLADLLAQDPPERADMLCSQGETLCNEAKEMLDQRRIATRWAGAGDGITLVYQRVTTRDCENRYLDNSSNMANLPPRTFGCSLMANSVQMVTDKRQFVNPPLLDFQDSEKASQNYQLYMRPPATARWSGSPMAIYPQAIAP